MYIKRHLAQTLRELSGVFSALLVTGARQVGKTTLLTQTFSKASYVSFDDSFISSFAKKDPRGFLSGYQNQLIIDEVQYVPELLPIIKVQTDARKREGLIAGKKTKADYLLTGSQQFRLMKDISESMAGRMAVSTLLGISLRELRAEDFYDCFLPTSAYLDKRKAVGVKDLDALSVWEIIVRGSLPELAANSDIPTASYYGSYVNTYLERDVRSLAQVGDLHLFNSFMMVLAARTGQVLNMSDLANSVGISVPTVKRWLSILETSNIIYLLKPYYTNVSKRALKTPKLYFLDTGLAAHLTGWTTADVLRRGAMSGAFFETFVITEILKTYYNKGIVEPPLYYYRDQQKNEIDLLLIQDGKIHPVEIKASATPHLSDIKPFNKLDQFNSAGPTRAEGALVCLYDDVVPLSASDRVIPLKYL